MTPEAIRQKRYRQRTTARTQSYTTALERIRHLSSDSTKPKGIEIHRIAVEALGEVK